MDARVLSRCGAAAGIAGALALAGCGSAGSTATGREASAAGGRFPVSVTGHFASTQRLARRTVLTISVHNTGHRALPDVAVTICNISCAPSARPNRGTSAAAFGHDKAGAADLANPSRPLWLLDRAPGACGFHCHTPGGAGSASVTSSSNTWALGRLAPGHTARFAWALTPIVAGRHVVAWQVAGDLTGAARAVTAAGRPAHGRFAVSVSSRPPRVHVSPSGRVVTTAG